MLALIQHRDRRVCAFGVLAMYFFYHWHVINEDFPGSIPTKIGLTQGGKRHIARQSHYLWCSTKCGEPRIQGVPYQQQQEKTCGDVEGVPDMQRSAVPNMQKSAVLDMQRSAVLDMQKSAVTDMQKSAVTDMQKSAVTDMQKPTVQLKTTYADTANGTCRAWGHVILIPFFEHQ
jgi:hypothetical protein